MTKFLNTTSLLWLVRQVLQFGGAWLSFQGYASDDDVRQAMGAFEQIIQIIGPVSFLVGFIANMVASFRTKVTVAGQAVGVGKIEAVKGTQPADVVVGVAKDVLRNQPNPLESFLQIFGRR